ncbi:general stress protein [Nocardia transvalensis]|uniref:general stress protein n=1 Tax=Nocardia transvalensis TaxID=37333 RepID=UPI00189418CC|nr:general stress protein [Nocardia transvalensis]MBF6329947.1 hypothetical protein [Nocardia transvalensis]
MRPVSAKAPNRVAVASYDSYSAAEQAVDSVADRGFPVQHTTICGVGLRLAEHVLGRLTYLKAAGLGALWGVWAGLLWGVVAGALSGLIWHALSGGRRDFLSARELLADRYEVLVDPEFADRAQELLQLPGSDRTEGRM